MTTSLLYSLSLHVALPISPFLFTGIRVLSIADDWREVRVALRLRPWTRNYVGTQYGGHLFSMTDPFWMLMIMHNQNGRSEEHTSELQSRGHLVCRLLLEK